MAPRASKLLGFIVALVVAAPVRAEYALIGWNNLGMHCMDADYSVFSILPPYNTIHAQLVDTRTGLVTVCPTVRLPQSSDAGVARNVELTLPYSTNMAAKPTKEQS